LFSEQQILINAENLYAIHVKKAMHTRQLSEHLHLIDLQPLRIPNFIASYVLRGKDSTAIIETGPTCSINNLLSGLQELGVSEEDVDYVAVSHIHIDHAGGAGTLMQHLPNARLLVHSKGAAHMVNPQRLWEASKQVLGEVAIAYQDIQAVPENRVVTPADGTIIDLGDNIKFKVLETLGHASHHLGFFEASSNGVFQGDAAGIYIPPLNVTIPTTPAPFQLDTTIASIQKIIEVTPSRLYYTHFGPVENAVGHLNGYVEQLRLWEKTVAESMKMGDNLQTVYQKVLDNDPQMRKAEEFIQEHIVLRKGVVMQSIQGFVKYLRKQQPSVPQA
jgi:glyoxylase-like metal-dependent hydrolase (beta-lactamase superfamily II)